MPLNRNQILEVHFFVFIGSYEKCAQSNKYARFKVSNSNNYYIWKVNKIIRMQVAI